MLQIPLRKLSELKPQAAQLDSIELASRDELANLQRERLAWTLRHAYENVPHYKAKFDAAGVHPDDFKDENFVRMLTNALFWTAKKDVPGR